MLYIMPTATVDVNGTNCGEAATRGFAWQGHPRHLREKSHGSDEDHELKERTAFGKKLNLAWK
jgi:hypothetical protein